jgi:hypothetical protein
MLNITQQQRAAILRAAKAAETVVIPPGRPRDAVSVSVYSDDAGEWFSVGRYTNHECDVACRLIEMQLSRQIRSGQAEPETLTAGQ